MLDMSLEYRCITKGRITLRSPVQYVMYRIVGINVGDGI